MWAVVGGREPHPHKWEVWGGAGAPPLNQQKIEKSCSKSGTLTLEQLKVTLQSLETLQTFPEFLALRLHVRRRNGRPHSTRWVHTESLLQTRWVTQWLDPLHLVEYGGWGRVGRGGAIL